MYSSTKFFRSIHPHLEHCKKEHISITLVISVFCYSALAIGAIIYVVINVLSHIQQGNNLKDLYTSSVDRDSHRDYRNENASELYTDPECWRE